MCTVGCASGSCDSGHCVTTAYGAICASGCEFAGDCPGDLSCQTDASDARICWFPDEHLEPVPSGLTVESARLTADTNNDGILNPGETAVLEFYPTNASMVP